MDLRDLRIYGIYVFTGLSNGFAFNLYLSLEFWWIYMDLRIDLHFLKTTPLGGDSSLNQIEKNHPVKTKIQYKAKKKKIQNK